MELVSRKVEYVPLCPSARGERRDLADSPPSPRPRWNAGPSKSKPPGALPSGSSLLSLKSYYRKLRTFKGTIKALINLRRFSGGKKIADSISEELTMPAIDARRATKAVARIAADGSSLGTLQDQVQSLVSDGHVVTEIDRHTAGEVSYRQQGNLEHYTEENLIKRVALQQHSHLVALTQRLWLCAIHTGHATTNSAGSAAALQFANYEAFMLRLHRLILPEFDVMASRELIQDDWARDTGGKDHLDYSFFHLSMFELVDLWTDTVDAEDYISLLYCIMHSLTFAWGDRHLLKPLEDVNPVDILEESKRITMEQIAADLKVELDSTEAGSYLSQIVASTTHEPCTPSDPIDRSKEPPQSTPETEGGSEATRQFDDPHAGHESDANTTTTTASEATIGSAETRQLALGTSQSTAIEGEQSAMSLHVSRGTTEADSGAGIRRSSRNRAQSASSMATRRASAFKRSMVANSNPRTFTPSLAEANAHVIYDASSFDQLSASPLMVKAYGQHHGEDIGASRRDHGLSISLDEDFRRTTGTYRMDGLYGSALEPAFAASRPSKLVADRSSVFLSGKEISHGLDLHLSGASTGAKADSSRVASFTLDGLSPRPPPLQIGSLGAYDPFDHIAVKPTTYILHPSPESSRPARPQTSRSYSSVSPTSPRTGSASYKRARQPSAVSTAHRPSAPSSLVVPTSPRSKLDLFDTEIGSMKHQPSHSFRTGSLLQQTRGDTSGAISLDPMLIKGRAATPRSGSKASELQLYQDLGRPPTSPRAVQGRSDGLGDLTSIVLETRSSPLQPKPSREQRGSALLDRSGANQMAMAASASTRRVSMAKLRPSSSRRIPAGSHPGSSRLHAPVGNAAALSIHSLAISPRTSS